MSNLLASSHIARQDGFLRGVNCHLMEPVLTGEKANGAWLIRALLEPVLTGE